jgi:hypothetical protein
VDLYFGIRGTLPNRINWESPNATERDCHNLIEMLIDIYGVQPKTAISNYVRNSAGDPGFLGGFSFLL